jgi:hypothetical protein
MRSERPWLRLVRDVEPEAPISSDAVDEEELELFEDHALYFRFKDVLVGEDPNVPIEMEEAPDTFDPDEVVIRLAFG